VCISTKISTPKKVGRTKHRASPISKSREKCPLVHPWIYAHAVKQLLVIS